MPKVTKPKTWILVGRSSEVSLDFDVFTENGAVQIAPLENTSRIKYIRASTGNELSLTSLYLDHVPDWDVCSWLREQSKGPILVETDLDLDEFQQGSSFEVKFIFSDLDDAVRFKLCFSEALKTP